MKSKSHWENFVFTLRYLFQKGKEFDGIEIKGSPYYLSRIEDALQLLKNVSPEDFLTVQSLDAIVESRKNFLSISMGKGTLTLKLEKDIEDRWLAGKIWFYARKTAIITKTNQGILVSSKVDESAYRQLFDEHYEIMKKLGCSFEELQYLADEILKLDSAIVKKT